MLYLLVSTFIMIAKALASPDPAASLYSAGLMLPVQPAGESLSDFLDRLFPAQPGNFSRNITSASAKSKRTYASFDATTPTSSYTNSYGLHQSCWDIDADSGTVTYNISVDFSQCSTGLNFGTDIGVYTFTNGSTNNKTSLRDMVADLYSLRHSRETPNPNYANHTAVVARLALEEATHLLNNGLICPNTSAPAQTDISLHNELRHLLANRHSYWTAVILSASGGAAIGGAVAAITDVIWNGNVTVQNVVQTAIVIGAVVFIGGILTRCEQVGRLDRAERVANRVQELVPQGRDAVAQNVYISWLRRQMSRIARRQAQEAVSEALSEAGVVGSEPTSPRTPGSLGGTPNTHYSDCLSELEAGQAASAIGEMSDVTLDLEPIQEVIEQLGPRNEDGSCRSQ